MSRWALVSQSLLHTLALLRSLMGRIKGTPMEVTLAATTLMECPLAARRSRKWIIRLRPTRGWAWTSSQALSTRFSNPKCSCLRLRLAHPPKWDTVIAKARAGFLAPILRADKHLWYQTTTSNKTCKPRLRAQRGSTTKVLGPSLDRLTTMVSSHQARNRTECLTGWATITEAVKDVATLSHENLSSLTPS